MAGLFSRRGFNIESLAVGPTEHEEVSRITILVNVAGSALEQVTNQLDKLVNVLTIVELKENDSVQRELLLIKVDVDESTRPEVVELVKVFDGKTADLGPEAVTIEVSGHPQKLDHLLQQLEPYGIREMVQSGVVALGRGPASIVHPRPRTSARHAKVS